MDKKKRLKSILRRLLGAFIYHHDPRGIRHTFHNPLWLI